MKNAKTQSTPVVKSRPVIKAGSIEWRGKNKDQARLVITLPSDGQGKRLKAYMNLGLVTPEDAELKLMQFHGDYHGMLDTDNANMTFGQLVDRWKKIRWQTKDLRPKTRQRYSEILDSRILPTLKDKKLREIKAKNIEHLLNQIKTGARKDKKKGPLSGQTLLHHYVLLKTLFAYAVECEYIRENPVKKGLRPKVAQARIRFFGRQEVNLLLQALKQTDLQHQTMIRLTLAIGCREGELAGLRYRDIDLDSDIVSIRNTRQYIDKANGVIEGSPKTEKSERDCGIPKSVTSLLALLKAEQTENQLFLGNKLTDDSHVFVNIDGNALHPSSPNQWFREFLTRHKLPELTFHGLRHTCASLLLAEGIDPATIAELLGHSTPSTTLRFYLHPSKESARRAISIMEDVLGEQDEVKK